MTVKERDFVRMSENVEATIWRLRETIRVAELAATHRLGQIRRLLMHEKHKAWKREFDFDRVETAAEMDEKRSRTSTSPVPDPFFYRNMVVSRRPHAPDEFTLEMKVDVEGLRMEIILSQPALLRVLHTAWHACCGLRGSSPSPSTRLLLESRETPQDMQGNTRKSIVKWLTFRYHSTRRPPRVQIQIFRRLPPHLPPKLLFIYG